MARVIRLSAHLRPDPARMVLRPFLPGASSFGGGQDRLDRLVGRALELPSSEAERLVRELQERHGDTFADLESTWTQHYQLAASRVPRLQGSEDRTRQLLIGAFLTQTYAYEAAALTNPSMVPVGDEDGVQAFIMSARAIGEGHISSIAFLSGSIDKRGSVNFDQRHHTVSNGSRSTPRYSRTAFTDKLQELGLLTPAARHILGLVSEGFTAEELMGALHKARDSDLDPLSTEDAVKRMHWLADSNYEVAFDDALPVSEHVISPAAPAESRGIEDARFVRFTDDDGTRTYYATYTAYDGVRILPQLIETTDFNRFRMATLTGPAVHHKGMALFPRKIRGEYVALSRHDHERSFILRSESIRSWSNAEVVFSPETGWDLVQTGNCGSPIETDAGWLVVTHGVGAMRRYVLGAVLLDLDEPTKVIGRLREPLIEPEEDERFGYVPDVIYSCGSMAHAGHLVVPFGYADSGIKVAVVSLDDVLGSMT